LNLRHPHLLALYDVKHDDEENCWVVMEYVAGECLEETLARFPNGLPPNEVMDWMHGIAAGVGYLHDHGIVHRDLKPGNIFNDEGVIKLGDYGLSKFISCSRRSGQTESIGTVHYMAPEVANGRYGREIDIYALGILLYEMLTGRVPFEGESVGEVLMKHLTAEPDLSLLSEPYRTVVKRALAKDPTVRFATVEEMMAALPAGTGQPVFQPIKTLEFSAESAPKKPTIEVVTATASYPDDEDPVWRWLRSTYNEATAYWQSLKLATPIKVLIALGGIILLARTTRSALPLLIWAAALYLAYRLIRRAMRSGTQAEQNRRNQILFGPDLATGLRQPAEPRQIVPVKEPTPKSSPRAIARYVLKPPRERLTELLGSLLVSALASIVISLVVVLLRGQPPEAAQYAWVAIVSTLGAWSVLIPSKIWEGRAAEPAMRRFVLLVIGLAVGALAYAVDAALWVNLPFDIVTRPLDNKYMPTEFYSHSDGSPLLQAYLVYFGFLFLLVRWWRSADRFRPTRLSLWATTSALFIAWILNFVWPFPQPWGFMVTATISLAVQLAAPWSPKQSARTRRPSI
jgi:hypothetical protein